MMTPTTVDDDGDEYHDETADGMMTTPATATVDDDWDDDDDETSVANITMTMTAAADDDDAADDDSVMLMMMKSCWQRHNCIRVLINSLQQFVWIIRSITIELS